MNRGEKDRLTVRYMRIGHVSPYHSRTHHCAAALTHCS